MGVKLGYILCTVFTVPFTFVYPIYATYSVLARPTQATTEADKNRWLMYWAILACVRVGEISFEWFLRWLPLYWLFKTLFLLYLAFPFRRTPGIGATRLYSLILYPALSLLDHNINCARENTAAIVNFVHEGLRTVGQWALAVAREAIRAAIEAANTLPAEPSAGGAVQGGEGAATVVFDTDMPMAGSPGESGPSGIRQRNVGTSDESIEERRRRLEAELVELDALAGKLK